TKQPHLESIAPVRTLPRTPGPPRTQTIAIENRPPASLRPNPAHNYATVTPDSYHTMGIQTRQARSCTQDDALEAPAVVVINDTTARRYLESEDAIGKRMAMGGKKAGQPALNRSGQTAWSEIVGLAAGVKKLNMSAETVPDVFVPYWQSPMQTPALVVR